jgi:hypothetical protein
VTATVELPTIAKELKEISQQLLDTAERLIEMTDASDGGEEQPGERWPPGQDRLG